MDGITTVQSRIYGVKSPFLSLYLSPGLALTRESFSGQIDVYIKIFIQ